MKKSYIIAIVVVVALILVGGGILVATKGHGNNSDSSMNGMNMNSSDTSSTKAVATNSVTIQGFAFSPANITVKPGAKVTWTNNDSVAHTVTKVEGQDGPDSGTLNPGASYSFTFAKAGTYHYHCQFHPNMAGTVTVQ